MFILLGKCKNAMNKLTLTQVLEEERFSLECLA